MLLQPRTHIPIQGVCPLFPDLLASHGPTDLHSFLQMSGMAAGSMIEADKRLRLHEVQMRRYKRTARDAEVWRRYEEDFNISKNPSSPSSDEKPESPKEG